MAASVGQVSVEVNFDAAEEKVREFTRKLQDLDAYIAEMDCALSDLAAKTHFLRDGGDPWGIERAEDDLLREGLRDWGTLADLY